MYVYDKRKPLTVVSSPESVEVLPRRRAEVNGSEYVFPGCGKSGHLVEPKTPWGHVVKRAKLEDCRMHDLHRTPGSWQAAGGASWLVTALSDDALATQLINAALASMAEHIVGNRPGRVEPRAIKRRPKEHALLTKPRNQARAELIGA